MKKQGKCPLCDLEYHPKRVLTHHHVLPRLWYNGRGPLLEVCSVCHQEFNHNNPMNVDYRWSKKDALWRWIRFCQTKSKDPLEAYPELFEEIIN